TLKDTVPKIGPEIPALNAGPKYRQEKKGAPSQERPFRFERAARLRARPAAGDRRHAAAVLRVAGLARIRAHRALLAVGDGLETAGRHAEADEIFLHRVGAAGAEGEVVLARAALVAMAFDG